MLLAVALVLLITTTGVAAQGVTVVTDPGGAIARLVGDAEVAGVTPVRFSQPLFGVYELVVSKPGYETHSTWVVLDPSRDLQFDVSLAAKTRLKAALRSAVIPGWGQLYTEHNGKAWLFAGLTVASGVAYLIADHRFDEKYDDYQGVRSRYNAASTTAERSRLWHDLSAAKRDAYDAEDVRRITIGAAIAVWGLNLLDALISSPGHSSEVSVKNLSIAPTADFDHVGMQVGVRF
jgi:hypothetical protein